MRILLRAGIKKQWQSVLAAGILFMLMSISIVTALTMEINANHYISQESNRAGFGDETIWIHTEKSGELWENNISVIEKKLTEINEVEQVWSQKLIFSGYSAGNVKSDEEGQLICFEPEKKIYRFLNEDTSGHSQMDKIAQGEIYVSPAMAENFHVGIGDTISFRLSRDGLTADFQIAGFFEDPFMGSSMIDMKSFLINAEDFEAVAATVQEADAFQILARTGAMLHITGKEDSLMQASKLSGMIQASPEIADYVEFSYSKESIEGFMLILQNIMVGFLMAFAILLGLVITLIMGYSISNAIERDYKNMGILKTIGGNSKLLRGLQLLQYGIGLLLGGIAGILIAVGISEVAAKRMVSSNGLLIPGNIAGLPSVITIGILFLLLESVVYWKTNKITRITPMLAIRGIRKENSKKNKIFKLQRSHMTMSLAVKQVLSAKRKYIGTMVVSLLLVCLVIMVGKMNRWLGPNGEGLMDSFSVAEHDIGVQPNHAMDMSQIEDVITQYVRITDTYELAMQSGTVNGTSFTINVLDEPEWFHIISGRTCITEDEILLTEYVASDLDVSIGDTVTVGAGGNQAEYRVTGIYVCANEMGANVGMSREGYNKIGDVNAFIWCHHYVLSSSLLNDTIMEELQRQYPMDADVHTNSWSGLAGIVSTMHFMTYCMYGIVVAVIFIVIVLTSSRLIQTEQRDMAILKSLGMTEKQLRMAFSFRFGVVTFMGSIIGRLVSNLFAEHLISALLRFFGISDFHTGFSIWTDIGMPFIIFFAFALMAYLYAGKIKKIDVVALIQTN